MPGRRLVLIRHQNGGLEVQTRGNSLPSAANKPPAVPRPKFWDWFAGTNPRKIPVYRGPTNAQEKEARSSELGKSRFFDCSSFNSTPFDEKTPLAVRLRPSVPHSISKSHEWPDSSSSRTSQRSTSNSNSFKYYFNDPPASSTDSTWSVESEKGSTDIVPFPDIDAADTKKKKKSSRDINKMDGTKETGDKKRGTSSIAFTAEQDKKLQELKRAADKSWKDIAAEMDLHPSQISQLKERFKAISAGDAASPPAWDSPNPPWENGATSADNTQAGKRRKRLKHGNFDNQDTNALHALAKQDERARWERVARKYFDETGRRMVARDVERVLLKR